ncbi:MAG: pitrilysin family protein [Rhodobacteraceae bacterium]|nr:pitrilysin family protein [Paracoccaceae bacterium]
MTGRLCTLAIAFLLIGSNAQATIEIQEFVTPGGASGWLVEDHAIPFAAIELRFRGGAAADPESEIGATHLMMALLEEGAGDLDAVAFRERVESLGARLEFDTHLESVTVSVQFVTENRDESLALLRSALHEPRFDEDAVERVRGQALAVIASNLKDPSEIAAMSFRQAMFGDHVYARTVEGDADTVAALDADALRRAHRRSLTSDKVVVAAAGDITVEELAGVVDFLVQDLPAFSQEPIGEASVVSTAVREHVDFPSPQSVVVFGHEGIRFRDEEFLTAYVVNEVLGGSGFLARLQQSVRVERGLTYGIYTGLVTFLEAGIVWGRFASGNETVDQAIEVVRQEWRRIAEDGLTQKELDDIKLFLIGSYPLRFDGNATIARILASMQYFGMPASYVSERNGMVEALTLEEVNRVAAGLFDPKRLSFVSVGQQPG